MDKFKPTLSRRGFNMASTSATLALACGWGAQAMAATETPKRGGILRIARTAAIDGFKLDGAIANETYEISQAVMEPLLRYSADGKTVLPGLAESFVVAPDGKAILFTLQQNATFSTGKKVTVEDVIFSVDQWKAGPNYGSVYALISSVDKINDRTFRFNLSSRNDSLPAFLTWSIAGIIPDKFGGQTADAFWLKPVGAGPFIVTDWEASGVINLVRNPYYYDKTRPYVDAIISTLPDNNQGVLQFRSGEVDIVSELVPVVARRYPDARLVKAKYHYTDVLLFNTTIAPLNDLRLRRAMALAIDYDAIVNGLYKGFGELPTGFLPPNVGMWAPPSKPYFRQNLSAARDLIKDAGLDGHTFELTYPPSYGLLSEILQQNLEKIGLKITLVPTDSGTFVANTSNGKFQLAVWSYNAISPNIGDPVSFILSTNYFFTGYSPKTLQADLQTFFESATKAEQLKAVVDMQNEGSDEVPFVALDHYQISTAVGATIHGVQSPPWGNIYYDTIWIS